jgi:DNA repair exonuclease SbcCD ATPase subunit
MLFLSSFTSLEQDLIDEIKNTQDEIKLEQDGIDELPKEIEDHIKEVKNSDSTAIRMLYGKKVRDIDAEICSLMYRRLEELEKDLERCFKRKEMLNRRIKLCENMLHKIQNISPFIQDCFREIEATYKSI